MRRLVYVALILASTPVDAAACHRYSRWYYPFPQRCGVAAHAARPRLALAALPTSFHPPPADARPEPPVGLGMPIPALSWKVEGEPDELARARLMLRAALEDAHAH